MSSPPPSYTSSASLSRSKTSRASIQSTADEMLRASLTRSVSSASSSSASLSRSHTSPDQLRSLADQMLRSSLSRSVSSTSSVSNQLPSYQSAMRSASSPVLPSPRVPIARADRQANAGRGKVTRSVSTTSVPASSSGMSAAEAKARLSDLQREVGRAHATLPPRSTQGVFKAACSTDLLFLIDTTNSMGPYLKAAKEQVKGIVDDVKKTFFNESDVRIAVVSYKDHNVSPNVEFLEFTSSTAEVWQFLDRLYTDWGGDFPEDVLGGLAKALAARWEHQTRCIIHIGDAPGHGRALHDGDESWDNYFKPRSEPHGLTYEPLLKQLVKLRINYAFLQITSTTDRMALAFARVYAEAGTGADGAKLLPSNFYYNQLNRTSRGFPAKGSSISGINGIGAGTGPLFEELQLGTTYDALRNMVVKTVTSSVSRTAAHLTLALSHGSKDTTGSSGSGVGWGGKKSSFNALTVVNEDATLGPKVPIKVQLEKSPPQWDTPGWLIEAMELEGFCPDMVVHSAGTLNDMMDSDDNIKLGVTELTIYSRPRPFAHGALRIASYARTAASTNRFVVKSFIKDGNGMAEMAEDMRIQALCKAFALEFNGLLQSAHPIDFIVTMALQNKLKTASVPRKGCLSLEPFIEGEYIKYNNNAGWVKPDSPDDSMNRTAQAFSHFTFERSFGHFLVNDLQGVGHNLTDPSIQTSDPERFKLNTTNLHEDGFKFFFAVHECNDICRQLGLLSNRDMMVNQDFKFREQWPTLDVTVCCSNKLCRRIVRLSSTRQASQFPGHYWCHECWTQLQASADSCICAASGPRHEFTVSRFFYESQGKVTPQNCPDHLKKDTTVSSGAVLGRGLWARMKDADTRASISGRT